MHQDTNTMLSIEQSTNVCSIAIMIGDETLAFRSWKEERRGGHHLFAMISEAIEEASIQAVDIECFAVGIGPGLFSGLRIAVSAASSMALPGRKPVTGVPSSEAIAISVFDDTDANVVAVLGDARRGYLWSHIARRGETARSTETHSLVTPESLSSHLQDVDIAVSPEWSRIGDSLAKYKPGNTRVTPEDSIPSAVAIARLARINRKQQDTGVPSPIYLHPAVDTREKDIK